MGVERAELPCERGVLVTVEVLVAEEHDLVPQDGGPDLVPGCVAERVPEIHALDLGSDGGLKRADGQVTLVAAGLDDCGHGGSFLGGRTEWEARTLNL